MSARTTTPPRRARHGSDHTAAALSKAAREHRTDTTWNRIPRVVLSAFLLQHDGKPRSASGEAECNRPRPCDSGFVRAERKRRRRRRSDLRALAAGEKLARADGE